MVERDDLPAWAARLREERRKRLWSQTDLARLMAQEAQREDLPWQEPVVLPARTSVVRRIKDYEAGRHMPGEPYRTLYCRVFKLTDAALFAGPAAADDDATDTVPIGMPAATAPDQPVDHTDIAVFRDMLGALTASDRRFGGRHARGYAIDYLATVIQPRLHAPAIGRIRQELFEVATEFSLRVAAMHLDAGNTRTSRALLGNAYATAHETDDLTLAAWVLARQGEQAVHEAMLAAYHRDRQTWQTHVRRAIGITGAAAAMAGGSPPRARAFLLSKQALALSMTGDRPAALAVVAEMRRCHDRTGDPDAEPDWMGFYEWAHIRHEEARIYYMLGMGEEAVAAVEDSLPARSDARPRAFSLGAQALGHLFARDPDVERACSLAHQLIAHAGRLESSRMTIRLDEVMRALAPYRREPAVQDVYEAARPVLTAAAI